MTQTTNHKASSTLQISLNWYYILFPLAMRIHLIRKRMSCQHDIIHDPYKGLIPKKAKFNTPQQKSAGFPIG